MKSTFFKDKFSLVVLAALAGFLIVVMPLLGPSFFSVHDETHMVDIYEMMRSLMLGGFPPRWAPDFIYGSGHPYFNFYYHLPFYLTSSILFLGASMTESFKLVMLIFVVLAFFGFYFFAKNHILKEFALVSAVLYIFSPYFAVDLYVRGALGELAVFALLPWCAFFIYKLVQKPNPVNLSLSAISIGFLSISHNVLHIFNFPILFAYGLVLIFINKENFKKRILFLLSSFIFGVFLSSYYLIPAIFERQFISSYEQINLADHFPFLKQLIIPHWGYGISHWGPGDNISFDVGVVNILAVVLAVGIFRFFRKESKFLTGFFISVFVICILLMNSRSLFLWNLLPIFHFVQFPWRLLMYTTFLTSLILGISLEQFSEKFKRFNPSSLSLFAIAVIVLLNFWHYRPGEYKQISDERYLELYFANRTLKGSGVRPNLSPEYKNFSEDFLPPTKWQMKRPTSLPKKLITTERPAKISYTVKNLSYQINVNSFGKNTLRINTTYFPGWSATIDGKEGTLMPYSKLGVMSLNIPSGKHQISVQFKDTPVRVFANWLSLLTALGLLGLVVSNKYLKLKWLV